MKQEIDCGVIRDLLPLYEDGAASEASQELVREHLKDCPECREELRKMRTPISVPPEEDQELWARFEARRQKERRKKRAAVICAGAVLAAILAAFGWYSRPRSWTELAGEGAAVCMAGMSVPDNNWDAGTALEKLDYEIWSLREADGEINRAFLEVLERFRFRKRLESLTAGDGVSLGGSGYVMVAVTAGEEADFFYFAENGRVVASAAGRGYDIYSSDPALRDALAQVVRAYGTPGKE